MISTSWRPRTGRLLVAAVILSLLIHLGGSALLTWLHGAAAISSVNAFSESKHDEKPEAALAMIFIEKRIPKTRSRVMKIVARPPASRAAAPAAHAQKPQPVQHLADPELSRAITTRAPRRVAVAGGISGVLPSVYRGTSRGAALHPSANQLTPEQLAALDHEFSGTIRDSRPDVTAQVAAVQEPVLGPRRFALNYNGIHEELRPRDGLFDAVSSRTLDRTHVAHNVHYTFLYPDGHLEQGYVPWPFVYRMRDDPFRQPGQKRVLWQPPPPGFQPTVPMSPQVQAYYDYVQSLK